MAFTTHQPNSMFVYWHQTDMHNVQQQSGGEARNGTVCTLVLAKIKNEAQYHLWHGFYRKKL